MPSLPAVTPGEMPSVLTDILDRLRRATLGEFDIGRELGRGGMAAVFLAHEIALDRKVAIKVMSPGLLMGEGMVDRFKQEAITIAQLHHPSIVSVYSVRHAEGLHFFVMRYVQGRSLEQVLQQARQLPLPIVRSILYQVGSALTYAHRSRVVHRDIKPANILIDQEGNAVVTDFGIAKAAERPTQTLTGTLVGTPAYMSPEQCSGGEVSGASDQYSLGAVAYELVTGVAPFTGSTLTVMQAHVERAPRPIHELCPDCPPELEAAILRMLEKEPAARWPRMTDALTALGAAPLPDDHPLRTELSRYTFPDGQSTPSATPTPTSPAPRSKASAAISGPWRSITGITIMPAPANLEVGDSFTLVAVIRGHHGTRLPPRTVLWTTDSPAILRIDGAAGVATALAAGSAMVTASCKGITALLRVEVAPPRADDIVIDPLTEPLQAGEEIRLDATARDKRGWPVYRSVNWLSADADIAVVTPHGTIAGRAPGTVRITAALDDARASIVIPVLPPRVAAVDIADPPTSVVTGQTVALKATPLDRANQPLPGRPIEWSSSDLTVAAVTSEGEVAAARPGSVVVTATCEGVRAMVRIAVVRESRVSAPGPKVRSAPRRRSRRARRRGLLAAGAAVAAGGLWLWLRPAPSVDRGGAAPAAYVGNTVGVDTSPPAISVVITQRPTRSLRPDSAATLAAEVRDSSGHAVPGAAVVWSSSDSTIVRVDRMTGRIRALRPGRALVAASSGSGRDSVVISVRRPGARVPVVAAITIAAAPALRIGETVALRAVVLGVKGDTLVGPEITWASSNPSVLTVEALTGVARARAPGTTLVLARSGNESSLAELTVRGGPVAAIQILGARPMAVRETLALRAAARDDNGGDLSGVQVAWSSSDSTVAEVDATTGAVVGREPGSVRITAAAEGATAWIRLTVLPRPEPLRPLSDAEPPLEARLLTGVEECYGAVQAKDLIRLRAMWRPETSAEEDRLRQLDRVLRERDADVGERIDHAPSLGLESASLEFVVPLVWKESSGAPRTSQPEFRAEFVRTAGRWELSTCRIVGSPKL